MNNHPAYSNNAQYPQYFHSGQSSSQHLAPYSSQSSQAFSTSQSTMSHPASTYYQQQQQQQGYAHAAPVQSNVTAPLPTSYGYQGFPPHSGHSSLPQPSDTIHHSQSGYPPAQQQAYAGYSSAGYASASPGLYPQYPEHGQAIPTGYSAHQRHSSSSTMTSSSPSSQSSSSSDRFPCPNCDKSFTRNFDRKRHMEIHLPGTVGSNRCRFCHKDYSRPDSLKRHLDNGCDKKPRS